MSSPFERPEAALWSARRDGPVLRITGALDVLTADAVADRLVTEVLGGIEQMFEFAKQASPEVEREQQRLLFLGQFTAMALDKSRRFGMTLPPGYDKMEEEVKRRMEQPGSNDAALPPVDSPSN